MPYRCFFIALLLLAPPIFASTSSAGDANIAFEDKKIALVLGGGGAKGAAHLGVLRALEDAGIEVDFITGTSIGAIVGGMYASGVSIDEIQSIITTKEWKKGFNDVVSRFELPMDLKRVEQQRLFRYQFGLSTDGIVAPQGLLEGQNILAIFREHIPNYWAYDNFLEMPIPFTAVATDVITGKAVPLRSGDLTLAMRASMSLPGIFSPVKFNRQLLVDGGVSNNLPIDIAQQWGADIVIAVDVGSKGKGEEELASFLGITQQLITLMTVRTAEAQILNLRAQDILLQPNIKGHSTLDFSALDELEDEGKRLIMAHMDTLSKYASKPPKPRPSNKAVPLVIKSIELQNNSKVPDSYILSMIHQPLGKPLDIATIERDVSILYAQNIFKQVRYTLNNTDDGMVLVVITEQLPRDLDYLQLGLRLSSPIGQGDSGNLNVLGYYHHDFPELKGSNIEVLATVGSNLEFGVIYNQPIDFPSDFFVASYYSYKAYDVRDQFSNVALNDWWMVKQHTGFDLGWNALDSLQFRLGPHYQIGSYTDQFKISGGVKRDFTNVGVRFEVNVDALEHYGLEQDGWYADVVYYDYLESWGSDADVSYIKSLLAYYNTYGRNTIGVTLSYEGYDDAPNSPEYWAQLGGFKNLSGYDYNGLSGRYAGLSVVDYRYRIDDNIDLPITIPIYIGGTLEAGNVWSESSDIQWDNLIYSGSLYLGASTPLGVFYLGYGRAQDNVDSFYISFGEK